MPTKIDLTNLRFGKLVVLREATKEEKVNRPGAYWICSCDCGSVVVKNGQGLRKGETTSCGCDLSEKLKQRPKKAFIDETGKQYGKLLVLYRDYEEEARHPHRGSTYWKCKCECGNEVSVLRNSLINKITQSCGCLRKERAKKHMSTLSSNNYIDETGNQYGKLLVLQKLDGDHETREGAKWLCQCECGNMKEVFGVDLRNGTTASCGCLGRSKGELKVEKLLQEYNLKFVREYAALIDNKRLRFDFAIFKDSQLLYLIEYDGKQHFISSQFFGGQDYLSVTQKHDTLKNKWCKNNNIPLIRIPYTHYDQLTINDLLVENSKFLIQ